MKAKKGFLAEGYISASQLKTWHNNPKEYIKRYILGEPSFNSKYMQFGTSVHKQLETNNFTDSTLEFLALRIEIPELKEHKIEVTHNQIKLLAIFDTLDETKNIVRDYKTGKAETWTMPIVENDVQVLFYGLVYYEKYGVYPRVVIEHLVTEEKDGEVSLTGDYFSFPVQITKSHITKAKNLIKKFVAWTESLTDEDIPTDETPLEFLPPLEKLGTLKA